jgi:hypothetical protein
VHFCPQCDLQLHSIRPYMSVPLFCDNCQKEYTIMGRDYHDTENYIAREIQRRIRSGEWKERIASI